MGRKGIIVALCHAFQAEAVDHTLQIVTVGGANGRQILCIRRRFGAGIFCVGRSGSRHGHGLHRLVDPYLLDALIFLQGGTIDRHGRDCEESQQQHGAEQNARSLETMRLPTREDADCQTQTHARNSQITQPRTVEEEHGKARKARQRNRQDAVWPAAQCPSDCQGGKNAQNRALGTWPDKPAADASPLGWISVGVGPGQGADNHHRKNDPQINNHGTEQSGEGSTIGTQKTHEAHRRKGQDKRSGLIGQILHPIAIAFIGLQTGHHMPC